MGSFITARRTSCPWAPAAGASPVSPWSTKVTSTEPPMVSWTLAATSYTRAHSCSLAGVTSAANNCTRVSTAGCRLEPRRRLCLSWPDCAPLPELDGSTRASRIGPVGWGGRPEMWRTSVRRSRTVSSRTPAPTQRRVCQQTGAGRQVVWHQAPLRAGALDGAQTLNTSRRGGASGGCSRPPRSGTASQRPTHRHLHHWGKSFWSYCPRCLRTDPKRMTAG